MRVFEMKAMFPGEPPQEPEALDVYVIAELPEQAIADLTLKGGYDIQILRELTEDERWKVRWLPSAEF